MTLPIIFLIVSLSFAFIKVQNENLVKEDGTTIMLKGLAFSNNAFNALNTEPITDHTLDDYAELKELGFNSARFYLSYLVFEDDDDPYNYLESGFEWLDSEVEAAKQNNIYLVFNMHFPQGGYQSSGTSDLWNYEENKERLKALWKEIARRYVNESIVVGYGLLNEPYVTNDSTPALQQWEDLMNGIADAIREVDDNHVLFVEPIIGYKIDGVTQSTALTDYRNLKLINDDNTCYEFHMYTPGYFTHQNASWTVYVDTTAVYPDDDFHIIGTNHWAAASTSSNSYDLDSQDSWQQIIGNNYTVDGSKGINNYYVMLYGLNIGDGYILMDDITITEYNENDEFVSTWTEDFSSQPSLYLYTADGSGSYSYETEVGHTNNGCLRLEGITDHAGSLQINVKYPTVTGNKYKIDGWIYVSGCNSSVDTRPRIDFNVADGICYTDKDYMRSIMEQFTDFGNVNNVPMYIGEFGTIIYSLIQVEVEILGFNYHDFHETNFGLYTNSGYVAKDNLNEVLKNVFVQKLQEMNDESNTDLSEESSSTNSESGSSSDISDEESTNNNDDKCGGVMVLLSILLLFMIY
ncbi:Cellulase family glycosylhydrolase [Entamoeba marina]